MVCTVYPALKKMIKLPLLIHYLSVKM
ncbi:hypothetical protein THIOKS11720016 [Thiocapsa sp. KS1]|nr:hypothetical protein THIOKS11720016 [Thiocapsa sp. KS1]